MRSLKYWYIVEFRVLGLPRDAAAEPITGLKYIQKMQGIPDTSKLCQQTSSRV